MRFVLVCLAVSLFSWSALAGSQHRGGGDAIGTGDKWELLDLIEKHDLEYYSLPTQDFFVSEFLPRYHKAVNNCAFPFFALMQFQHQINQVAARNIDFFPDEKRGYIENRGLPSGHASFHSMLYHEILRMYPRELVWTMTDKDLEEIDDEGAVRIPADFSGDVEKKQLAIQKDGIVIIHRPIFEKLSPRSKAALFMHELALYVQLNGNIEGLRKNGTARVREFVNFVFSLPEGARIPFAAYEQFCGWDGVFFAGTTYKVNFEGYVGAGPRGDVYSVKIIGSR